jgi:carboxyl-terminal processing protease
MTSRSRLIVLLISTPVILLVVVGGVLSRAMGREESYGPMKTFDEVVTLILNNYVESVEPDRIMQGAMRGLAEGLDADSAWLTPEETKSVLRKSADPKGGIGVELRTGDFIRAIDDQPTREMSAWTGARLLRGAPGSKVKLTMIRGNAAEPHVVELLREADTVPEVTGRIVKPGVGLLRIPSFTDHTAADVKQAVATLKKDGAAHLLIDLRNTGDGGPELGIAPARLFVGDGVIVSRESRSGPKQDVTAEAGDGAITMPVTLLVTNGTSQAAEVFAAALAGHKRADVVGEHTIGRAATQELVRLPDGSGLWLSTTRYDAPGGTAIHEKGITPDLEVAEPDVDFGEKAPDTDPILDKALERVAGAVKAAA